MFGELKQCICTQFHRWLLVRLFLTNHSLTMNTAYRIILNTLTTRYCHFNYLNRLMFITARPFKTSHHVVSEKKFNLDSSKIVKRDGTVIRKKTEEDKLITLFHDSTEKVLKMTEALKIAAHKRLYLVKINKPTSKSMDYYQLSKAPDLNSNQLDKKKKEVKKYVFKVNIAENDLLVKARGLINALNKYKIGSYIIESNTKEPEKTDALSSRIQKAIKDAGVNFKIKSIQGSYFYKTFIVEKKEQDGPPGDNVEEAQKNERSDPSRERERE